MVKSHIKSEIIGRLLIHEIYEMQNVGLPHIFDR